MNIRFVIFSFIICLLCFAPGYSYAQNDFTSEKDLIKQAEKFFLEENYMEARPLFSQLLSLHPQDINYTFKFGICEIYANRNKSACVQWLEKSTQAPNAESKYFYYLGLAYHLNYRFDEAIASYNTFLQKADKKTASQFPVQRQINMCNYAKQLLVEVQDLVVVESKEVKREEFYRNYNVRQDAGKLIIKPDEFKSSIDVKDGESSIIFFPKENPIIFYSSYGEDKSNGKDIFKVAKLPNGQWSKPENLGSVVNTKEDEDFSYVTPDGLTLFFCSKGHNSIGGYDVFKTTREENSNNWSKPINMGFAINSPDDDILYVADPQVGVAYFATTRQSVQNMILVHKLNIDEKPLENVIIKGRFSVDSKPELTSAKITIFTMENEEIVGEFNTKEESGDYLLIVPAGQKYKMVINADDLDPISQTIDIPVQKKAEAMDQKINIAHVNGKDTIIVTNNFWGLVKESDRLLDPRVLKEQAKLMAMLPEEESADTVLASTEPETFEIAEADTIKEEEKKAISKNVSDNELVNIAYDDAQKAQKEAETYREDANIAYFIAQKRSELVAKQTDEIETLEEKIKQASGNASVNDMDELKKLKQQASQCGMEAKVAFNIAKKMENEANVIQKESELTLSFAKELEAAAKSNSDEKAIKILEEQKKKLEELDKQRYANTYSSEIMEDLSSDKLSSSQEAKERARKLQEETVAINSQIQKLKHEIEGTQDQKQKENLQKQLQSLEKTEQESQLKAQTAFKLAKELENEAGNLKEEAELISDVLSEINTGYDKNKVASQKIDKAILNEQIEAIQSKTLAYKKEEEPLSTELALLTSNESNTENKTELSSSSNNESAKVSTITSLSNDSVDVFELDKGELNGTDSLFASSFQEYYKSEQLGKWLNLIQEDITALKDSLKNPDNRNNQQEIEASIKDLEQLLQEKQVEKQEIYQEAATKKFTALMASTSGAKLSKKEEKEREAQYEERKQHYFKAKGFVLEKPLLLDTTGSETAYKKSTYYKKQYQFYTREISETQKAIDSSTDPVFKKEADHKLKTYRSLSVQKYTEYEETLSLADSLKKKEEEAKLASMEQANVIIASSDTSANIIELNVTSDSSITAQADTSKKTQEKLPAIVLPPLERKDFAIEDIAIEVEKAKTFEREAKAYEQEAEMIGQNIDQITDSVIIHRGQNDINSLERKAFYLRERADTCHARIYLMKQIITAEIKAKNDSIQKTIEAKTVETEKTKKKKGKKAKQEEELAKQKELEKAKADSLAAIRPIKTDTTNFSNEAERLQLLADYYAEIANYAKEDAAKLRAESAELRKTALATDDAAAKEATLKSVLEIDDKANNKDQEAQRLMNISNDYKQQAKEELARLGDTLNLAYSIKGNKKLEALLVMYEQAYKKDKEAENFNKQFEYAETMISTTKNKEDKEELQEKSGELKSKANTLYEQSAKAYYDANKELFTINKTNLKKISQKSFNNSEIMMANLLEDEVVFYNKKVDSLNSLAATISDPEKLNPIIDEMIKNQKLVIERQKKAGEIYMRLRSDTSIHQLYFSAGDFINQAAKNVHVESVSPDAFLASTNQKGRKAKEGKDEMATTNIDSKSDTAKTVSSTENTLAAHNENKLQTSNQSEPKDTSSGISSLASNKQATNQEQNQQQASAANNVNQISKGETSAVEHTDILSTLTADQIELLNDPKVREVLNSTEYKNYKVISLDANALNDLAAIEHENSQQWKNAGNEANEKAKTILQSSEKLKGKELEREVAKSEEYYQQAKIYFAKADSVKKIADNITSQSVAKTNESELFLQQLDKITYQKIMSITADTALDNLVSRVMLEGKSMNELLAKADQEAPKSAQTQQTQTSKDKEQAKTTQLATNTANNLTNQNNVQSKTQSTGTQTNDEDKTTTTSSTTTSATTIASNTIPNKTVSGTTTSSQTTTTPGTSAKLSKLSKDVVTNVGKLKAIDYTFITLDQSAYTSSNPIPVDVKTPQGIYFMVQVGAFKNPIPQELFKGITPITGETTPQGVIRYSAGMFKTFESCNYAKNMIRGMGYNDAFVVAYIDGKRVSLQDALAKLVQLEGAERISYKQSEQLELAQLKDLKLPVASASEQEIKNATSNASDISKTFGLLYTVQIGVYSSPVTPDKLYNITPISYLKTPSGYIRYSTGQFKKFSEADSRKNQVVDIGVKDAFVTAYYNGDRITIADAAAIERGDKPEILAQLESGNNNSQQNATSNSKTTETSKTTHNSQLATQNAIVFKVQMGAFKGDVAVKMVNVFLQFNSYGVEQYKNENAYTIYTAGSFTDFNSANALKAKVVQAGITDAFVIAFNNGKRISVTEAINMLKNK